MKDGSGVREVPPLTRQEWIKAKRKARRFYADRTRKWKAHVRQRNGDLGYGHEAECSETSPSECPIFSSDEDLISSSPDTPSPSSPDTPSPPWTKEALQKLQKENDLWDSDTTDDELCQEEEEKRRRKEVRIWASNSESFQSEVQACRRMQEDLGYECPL